MSVCMWTVPYGPQGGAPVAVAPPRDTVPCAAREEGQGPRRMVGEPGPAWPKDSLASAHPTPRCVFASALPVNYPSAHGAHTRIFTQNKGGSETQPRALSSYHSSPTQLGTLAQQTRGEAAHIQPPSFLQRNDSLSDPLLLNWFLMKC